MGGAQCASPPYPPPCTRNPAELRRRSDKLFHTRTREGTKARQTRCNQMSPCLNAAQMSLLPPRLIYGGKLSGDRGKFRGLGARVSLSSTNLEAGVKNNTDVMGRLADGAGFLLAYMARSRADPRDVSQITPAPRSRRRAGTLIAGDARRKGNNPPLGDWCSKDNFRGQACYNARKKRRRKDKPSEPRIQGPSSANK